MNANCLLAAVPCLPAAVRYSLVLAWLVLAAACAASPVEDAATPGTDTTRSDGLEVLVTFPMIEHPVDPAAGSKRSYHSGHDWAVPLYNRQQARRFARDHGLSLKAAWPIEVLGVYCVAYVASSATTAEALVERLREDPRPTLVQPNAEFSGMTVTTARLYDDPLVDVQYGHFVEKLADLHAITGGEEVRVGVIDTSVDLDHPDLSGQVTRQVEFVPAAGLESRLHGTAVTGVIGAAADNGEGLVGIAPRADIHVYGACSHRDEGTVCSSFSIAQALAAALEENMAVINMSFAGPEDPLLSALLEKAVEADTVLIAAGNADAPDKRFPAGSPGVYAADADHDFWFARPERLSTRAGGSYQVFFGSSIASAGMAGLATLIRAQSSPVETRELLEWLFDSDCASTTPPTTSCTIDPDQLCD